MNINQKDVSFSNSNANSAEGNNFIFSRLQAMKNANENSNISYPAVQPTVNQQAQSLPTDINNISSKTQDNPNDSQQLLNKEDNSKKYFNYAKVLTGFSFAALATSAVLFVNKKSPTTEVKEVIKEITKVVTKEVFQPNDKIIPVTIKKLEETALHQEFVKSGKSFFEFVKGLPNEVANKTKEFLFAVTADKENGVEFVKQITEDPRKSREIVRTLIEKIGGRNNFIDWYHHDNGYNRAYASYTGQLFDKAQSFEELLQHSPNWALYPVSEKFKESFAKKATLGTNPFGFNREQYTKLVENIREKTGLGYHLKHKINVCNKLKEDPNLLKELCNNPEILKTINDGEVPEKYTSPEKLGLLKSLKNMISQNELEELGNGGKFMLSLERELQETKKHKFEGNEIEILTPGRTEKGIAKITKDSKSYIIKFDLGTYIGSDDGYRYHRRVLPDSIFNNAKVDWYLTANNCEHATKIRHYDPYTESAIYEYIPEINEGSNWNHPLKANKKVRSLNDLGVFVNDVNDGNFGNLNGTAKVIDSGHVRYKDTLKPEQPGYHHQIPNSVGPDFTDDLISLSGGQ